jgi:hypothetical protein
MGRLGIPLWQILRIQKFLPVPPGHSQKFFHRRAIGQIEIMASLLQQASSSFLVLKDSLAEENASVESQNSIAVILDITESTLFAVARTPSNPKPQVQSAPS